MSLVLFDDNGYEYYNNSYFSFESDKSHEILFDYVFKDVSVLSNLLEQYVKKRMDINNFELTNYLTTNNDGEEIIELLKSFHKYYEYEYKKVFIEAIADYFNALLINSQYRNIHSEEKNEEDWKRWYIERFKVLAGTNLQPTDKPIKFYEKYRYLSGEDTQDYVVDITETFYILPNTKAFYREIRTHQLVQSMLYWLLDISVPTIGHLTIPQRTWIYTHIFDSMHEVVNKHLSFNTITLFNTNRIRDDEEDFLYDLFVPLRVSENSNNLVDLDNVSEETLKKLEEVVKYSENISLKNMKEYYDIDNLYQLVFLEIFYMMRSNTKIKKCKNCGRYFVINDQKLAYCNRVVEGETEPCSVIGSRRSYQKKLKNDYPLQIYTRAYKTHLARRKRGTMSESDFLIWADKAKKQLYQVRSSELEVTQFEKWLKKDNRKNKNSHSVDN